MQYKEENIEIAKRRFASALCNEALVVQSCLAMIENPEKVNISAVEFAKMILNTVQCPWDELKKVNSLACKYSEIAVEQYLTQGKLSEKAPIHLVK